MAIPNDLRQINRRAVVLAALRPQLSTRTVLARSTGLSLPTTGKIVDDLLAAGVLESVTDSAPTGRTGPGRPGHLVKLNDSRPRFLAVQLGPVNTRLAPLTIAPPLLADQWAAVIPTPHSLARWTSAVASAAKPMLAGDLLAVLVSIPGIFDDVTGRTLLSPNARWMEGEAIATALGQALGLPAYGIQEIRCLALGHRLTDPTADDFLLVDFGIGVGSAAVLRGELLRGQLSFTGELGHTPVPGNDRPCGCGGVGCLETLVGRRHLLPDPDDVEMPTASDAAPNADATQRVHLRYALEVSGLGIAAALNVLGLNHAVITGSFANLPVEPFDDLRSAITAGAIAARFGDVRVDAVRRHRLAGLASLGIDRVVAPV
jgi:predicted NBD/HSP70 family sugar kinase